MKTIKNFILKVGDWVEEIGLFLSSVLFFFCSVALFIFIYFLIIMPYEFGGIKAVAILLGTLISIPVLFLAPSFVIRQISRFIHHLDEKRYEAKSKSNIRLVEDDDR